MTDLVICCDAAPVYFQEKNNQWGYKFEHVKSLLVWFLLKFNTSPPFHGSDFIIQMNKSLWINLDKKIAI